MAPDLGASRLHNSRARDFASQSRWLASLAHQPPEEDQPKRARMADVTEEWWAARQHLPAVFTDSTDSWRAAERWSSVEAITSHYGHLVLDLAEDVRLTLGEYAAYAARTGADCPYYWFDRGLKGERAALRDDYSVHSIFEDDLLGLIPGAGMRYFICGGPRTGTALHADPLLTGAWNTCLAGHKRWVLLPPDSPLERFGSAARRAQMPCAWFQDVLPHLRAAAANGDLSCMEVVQGPGDTIYVPSGWHHAVLNLDWSVAITHNMIHARSLPDLWPRFMAAYPVFAAAVLEPQVRAERPEVHARLQLAAGIEAFRAALVPPDDSELRDSDHVCQQLVRAVDQRACALPATKADVRGSYSLGERLVAVARAIRQSPAHQLPFTPPADVRGARALSAALAVVGLRANDTAGMLEESQV